MHCEALWLSLVMVSLWMALWELSIKGAHNFLQWGGGLHLFWSSETLAGMYYRHMVDTLYFRESFVQAFLEKTDELHISVVNRDKAGAIYISPVECIVLFSTWSASKSYQKSDYSGWKYIP